MRVAAIELELVERHVGERPALLGLLLDGQPFVVGKPRQVVVQVERQVLSPKSTSACDRWRAPAVGAAGGTCKLSHVDVLGTGTFRALPDGE